MKSPESVRQYKGCGLYTNIFWIILTIVAVYFFAHYIGIDSVRQRVTAAGVWGLVIVILLKASTLVVAPLGGSPLYPIAGVAFGFWYGFLYTFIGDILGAAIAFFISRWFGRRIVQYFVTRPGMKLLEVILGYLGTTRGLIYARLIFFSFPEGVVYAAGLTTIPFWKFLVLMIPIGIGPHIFMVWSDRTHLCATHLLFISRRSGVRSGIDYHSLLEISRPHDTNWHRSPHIHGLVRSDSSMRDSSSFHFPKEWCTQRD